MLSKYPPAPKITKELLMEAFAEFARQFRCDAPTLVKAYMYVNDGDGFKIGKYLDDLGWDITASDVEELDNLQWIADDTLKKARQKWVEDNNIQPEYEVGTVLTKGVITGFCEYSPAYYLVKRMEDNDNSRLLVKFEEAKLKHE